MKPGKLRTFIDIKEVAKMKNLNIKNAARGLLGTKRKCWLLALMLLAAALPAAGMPREVYAEDVETESEAVQIEETENEENEAGEINAEEDPDEGVTVTITSEPAEKKQESTEAPVKAVKKISKTVKIPQKSLNTYALIGTYGTKSIANTPLPRLEDFITDSHLYQGNDEIQPGGQVVVGEHYTYTVQFEEDDEKSFQEEMEFQLPSNVTCEEKTDRPIYDVNERGERTQVGTYSVDKNGKVTVHLNKDYIESTQHKEMNMTFDLTVTDAGEGGGITFPWEDNIDGTFTTVNEPDASLEKTAGSYLPSDPGGPCVEYTVEAKVSQGAIKDPTLEDQMQSGLTYREGSASVEIYNEKGELVKEYKEGELGESTTPRLVPVKDATGKNTGWKLDGLPSPLEKDWKVVIKYKGDVDLNALESTLTGNVLKYTVNNKVILDGEKPNGDDWTPKEVTEEKKIEDKLLRKTGKLDEEDIVKYPNDLEWDIEVGSGSTDVRGSKVSDTLTGDHWIDERRELRVKWKDENGNTIRNYKIPWDEAEKYGLYPVEDENGKIIGFTFDIPEEGTSQGDGHKPPWTFWDGIDGDPNRKWEQGDHIKITYYTTYDPEAANKQFDNSVDVDINRGPTVGDNAGVGIGVGEVDKGLVEEEEYFLYTINVDVPGEPKLSELFKKAHDTTDRCFYLQDQLELTDKSGQRYFVDNIPEIADLYVMVNGTKQQFTEDVPDKKPHWYHVAHIGNEYEDSDDGPVKGRREFQIWFNTNVSTENSYWPFSEACKLTVTYRIPKDAKMIFDGGKDGSYETNRTFEDFLKEGCKVTNEIDVKTRYGTDVFTGKNEYTTTPQKGDVIKRADHKTSETGEEIIEYQVDFNAFTEENGTYKGIGKIDPEKFYLEDQFDNRLEYVPDSLYVELIKPDKRTETRYTFRYVGDPTITEGSGNTPSVIEAHAAGFTKLEEGGTGSESVKTLSEYMKNDTEGVKDTLYRFHYSLKLKDEYMLAGDEDEDITLNNSATVHYGDESGTDDASVSFKPDVLKKEGVYAQKDDKTDVVNYKIDVNPGAADMARSFSEKYNMDHYTLTDEMDSKLTLDSGSVKVYRINKDGTETQLERTSEKSLVKPDEDYYVLQEDEENIFKIILPDEQHLRIEYTAFVNGHSGQSGTAVNHVTLDASITVTDSNDAEYEINNDEATIRGDKMLKLFKRDAASDEYMSDATFAVYTITKSGGTIEAKIGGETKEFEEWKNGIKPDALEGVEISPKGSYDGEYYILLETEAPRGYKGDPTPVVFKFGEPEKDEATGKDKEEKVTVTYDGNTYTDVVVKYIHTGNNVVVFDNSPDVYELPETGGPGPMTYTLAGLLLILGGTFCLMYRRNRIQKGGW